MFRRRIYAATGLEQVGLVLSMAGGPDGIDNSIGITTLFVFDPYKP